jgi:hypothetical protein
LQIDILMNAKVGSLNVDLTLETARFEAGVGRSQGSLRRLETSMQQLGKTNGSMRSGMQQLGFQLSDVATQFASGTKASVIFAQQGGQVVQALQLMSGGTSRFATFMGGPWGIALTAGTVALSPFIAKLFDTRDAADSARGALENLIKARQMEKDRVLAPIRTQEAIAALRQEQAMLERRQKFGQRGLNTGEQNRLETVRSMISEGEAARQWEIERTKRPTKTPTVKSPRSGSKGPSADDIERRFNDELVGLTQQTLSARQSLAMSAQEEAELELRSVEWARIQTKQKIDADKDYSAAQKADLKSQLERLALNQREAVDRKLSRRLEDEAAALGDQQIAAQRERLQSLASLADTDADRQKIALEMLALDQQARRDALDRVANSPTRSDAERALARSGLAGFDGQASLERAATERATETRTQAFARSLSRTPEQINDAIDGIKISGLDALNDGLAQAIAGTTKLGDVFKSIAQQIIADLARIMIRQTIVNSLAGALGLGGPKLSGIDTAGLTNLANTIKVPGFASGTSFAPGGLSLVGENGPELVNMPRGSKVFNNGDTRDLLGSRIQVEAVPNPYFDVRVRQVSASTAAPMAVASGMQARSAAKGDMARTARKRIP